MCQTSSNTATTAAIIKESPAQHHELVKMYLTIRECRYIHRVLNEKFLLLQAKGLPDRNNALEQLLDHFERDAYPNASTPIHKKDHLSNFIEENDIDELNNLLKEVYVEGTLYAD